MKLCIQTSYGTSLPYVLWNTKTQFMKQWAYYVEVTCFGASCNKWPPVVPRSVRWRGQREELLVKGWQLIIYIGQWLWLPSAVPATSISPPAVAFHFSARTLRESILYKSHNGINGLYRRWRSGPVFWKVLSHTSQYICQLFLLFTPKRTWKAFYSTASKETPLLLCA